MAEIKKKYEELIQTLLHASQDYYQTDKEDMTDSEYDDKLNYLRELAAQDDTLSKDSRVMELLEHSVAGGSKPEGSLIKHNVPMLSLGKANTFEEVKDYFDKMVAVGVPIFDLQAKLDGFAISVIYKNGVPVQVSTRGDGSEGEDLTYLLTSNEVSIKGLPMKTSQLQDFEVRGELFARNTQFANFNKARLAKTGSAFKNSRNGVVGVIKSTASGLGYNAELTFSAYTMVIDGEYHGVSRLEKYEPNFIPVTYLTVDEWNKTGETEKLTVGRDFDKMMELINKFGQRRPEFDIPTDGIVIKPTSEGVYYKKMGNTAHHPNAFIAFKYPAEKAEAKVLRIDVSVGKTGKLTPILTITPTTIKGTTIEHVSGHNFNWLYSKDIRIGSKILVERANDVIPAVATVLDPGENDKFPIPTVCPECGAKLIGDDSPIPKTLKCSNDECPSRWFFFARTACGKQGLDIDGLNNVSLEALCGSGKFNKMADLFTVTVDDLASLIVGKTTKGNDKKFGKVRAKKIIEGINKARTSTPAYKLLTCLGFYDLGPSTAKNLLKHFNTIDKVLEATNDELNKVEGFSTIKLEKFFERHLFAETTYKELLVNGVTPVYDTKNNQVRTNGKSFCITGNVPEGFKNRNEFVDYMESLGFTWDSSVKKDTDYVIGDETSTSSKIAKAKKYNVPIVADYHELIK